MRTCLALRPSDYTEAREEFVRAVFRLNATEGQEQVFCSELAALILQVRLHAYHP